MLLACTSCRVYYSGDAKLLACPCNTLLLVLDDSRQEALVARGFRLGRHVPVRPDSHKQLFEGLEGLGISTAKMMQGEDGGRPWVQYLEMTNGDRLWLTAGRGVAAVHAWTAYQEVTDE